ncbi:MAG: DUF3597 domain-containing protein [Hyphomicrobiaceae bacterium]
MSIFNSIKDAIFGGPATASPAAPATAGAADAKPAAGAATPGAAGKVDITAMLDGLKKKQSESLDWRRSIVDLMKLLNLDSSLKSRKELATELGYKGDMGDSATMNVWLHKQVMTKLAEHGGVVPDELKS